MTENDLISVREGLRDPRSFFDRLLRQPGGYVRSFLRPPRQTLFGFPKTVAPEALPPEPEAESEPVTEVKDPWPDLSGWPWQSPARMVPAKMPSGKPWPRISIVTPSFHQGEFIDQTIR